jgi:uncharacterized protein YbaR (Trm112 family)
MVDPELLEILVCPETKKTVHLAEKDLLDRVNLQVAERRLTTRGGKTVAEKLEGGLVREDGLLLYPIRVGIPVMLIDEAIPLDALH